MIVFQINEIRNQLPSFKQANILIGEKLARRAIEIDLWWNHIGKGEEDIGRKIRGDSGALFVAKNTIYHIELQ